jgi:excisionase family DNA binding protein
MNRFFTGIELAEAYRLPRHLHEQLLAEVAAVEKNDQGEPLFLEAHVDSWLADEYADVPRKSSPGDEFLTTREVARLLCCSYTEARDRLLDGRIKAIKDGRWLRTRREWIEQYVAEKTVKPHDPEMVDVPRPRVKRYVNVGIKLKKGGAGWRFLNRLSKD